MNWEEELKEIAHSVFTNERGQEFVVLFERCEPFIKSLLKEQRIVCSAVFYADFYANETTQADLDYDDTIQNIKNAPEPGVVK